MCWLVKLMLLGYDYFYAETLTGPLKRPYTKNFAKAMYCKSAFHAVTSQVTCALLKIAEVVIQRRGQ